MLNTREVPYLYSRDSIYLETKLLNKNSIEMNMVI